jgi:hypothetical protein
VIGALASTGCGGGGDDTSTQTDTAEQPNVIDQGVRAIKAGGGGDVPEFADKAKSKPDGAIGLRISLPPGRDVHATKVEIKQKKNKLVIKTTAKGIPEPATSRIVSTEGEIGLKDVLFNCQLPPNTFCPVRSQRVGSGAVLSFKATRNIAMRLDIGKPGELPPEGQIPLGSSSPGSAVSAEVTVRTAGTETEGPPTNTTEAKPDDHVSVTVRPERGSPADATLRIAFPKTSGDSITVEGGGTDGQPSSTATIDSSKGPIRVENIRYNCKLPPNSFCPIDVRQTKTGIEMALKTPTTPVPLQLTLAGA